MQQFSQRAAFAVLGVLAAAGLSGCGGGARLLEDPLPVERVAAVATTSDQQIDVALDWVIVRDGPGTWAQNADWDEYQISIRNGGARPIVVHQVTVTDAVGHVLMPRESRKALVKGSRNTVRRFDTQNLEVQAGASPGALLAAGGGVLLAGSAVYSTGMIALFSSGASATPLMVGSGLALAAPVIAVGGIVKASRNSKVDAVIQNRRTPLPLEIAPGDAASLNVFFPLAPSPQQVRVNFDVDGERRTLVLDTQEALSGLHLP